MSWYGYDDYVPVAQKQAKAQKQLQTLRKKNANIAPVVIEGRKIAKTWWGQAWCKNLESYADFSNRIGRGSAYVRNGFVLDLQIEPGAVYAKVYGTHLYNITINIDPLDKRIKDDIAAAVGHRIDSIESLVSGAFPEDLRAVFLQQGTGLFPTPKEIHMDCSCPDWAEMCKHVAAALYGVGARLDEDPLLFFKLRGIGMSEFIKRSIDEKMKSLLRNAGKKTGRVMEEADLGELFGV